MITHFLGEDEVEAYCRDLVSRLADLESAYPTLWVALGESGNKLAERLVKLLPADLLAKTNLFAATFDRETEKVAFLEISEDEIPRDQPVLVIDSAIHSGRSMLALHKRMIAHGSKSVLSYGLVLKKSSALVPTFFGLVIDDKDRVYFDLPVIPNNRLLESPPYGLLRQITEDDADRKIEDIGPPFSDLSVGDLLYEKETRGFQVYVYECEQKMLGFISFRKKGSSLFIDGWGTAIEARGRGIGAATIRWAETWARSSRCDSIELWAFEDVVARYERYDYKFTEGERIRSLGPDQKYRVMKKALLYNVKIGANEDYRA